jgi:Thrombospondin type 3 repeat
MITTLTWRGAVLAVISFAALTGSGRAAAAIPPPSLQGEFLTDTIGGDIDESTYSCDLDGTSSITFVHTSPVTSGPYPGTLTDTVTLTLGPAETVDLGFTTVERSPILTLAGTFEIVGANGAVTGATEMTEAEMGSSNYGLCWEDTPAAQIIASDLSYEADLPGDWLDNGDTWINGNVYADPAVGGQGTNNYRHGFPSSDGVMPVGTTPSDIDGDGVDDASDNCVDVANADQADTDGDTVGDDCDATPNGDNDQDGVDAASDNCVDVANADQADADGDGAGDACDPTPNGDADEDGVDDGTDNCLGVANAGQADSDGDGAGDGCDPTPNGQRPPASSTACRLGGWVDHTDDEGRPFRNQGDCVSYVATHGRNGAAG